LPGEIVYETPISKITREKWTENVAQAAEGLLCKCKALSSNSSLTKTNKQKTNQPTKQKTPAEWSYWV
jgi:hypothetical protein